jgi:hypothetical protein
MSTTRTRKRFARLALATIGAAAAYGITATAVDLTAEPAEQEAATAIEYGLIAAHSRGITMTGID